MIGAFAATLHGSMVRTGDADITPDPARDNLDRLAAALNAMDVSIRTSQTHYDDLDLATLRKLLDRITRGVEE